MIWEKEDFMTVQIRVLLMLHVEFKTSVKDVVETLGIDCDDAEEALDFFRESGYTRGKSNLLTECGYELKQQAIRERWLRWPSSTSTR